MKQAFNAGAALGGVVSGSAAAEADGDAASDSTAAEADGDEASGSAVAEGDVDEADDGEALPPAQAAVEINIIRVSTKIKIFFIVSPP